MPPACRVDAAMNSIEMAGTAFSAVRSNRSRSMLTSLGVTIGVAAVVSLVGLATGMGDYVEERFESALDASVFRIGRTGGGLRDAGAMAESARRPDVTEAQAMALAGMMVTDSVVSWSAGTTATVSSRGMSVEEVTLNGVSPSWLGLSSLDIENGRVFTEAEDSVRARVCVIGADIVAEIFPEGLVEGSAISVSGNRFMVVGSTAARGSVFGRSRDSFVIVPFSTYEGLFTNLGPDVEIAILPASGTSVEAASAEAAGVFRVIRGLSDGDDDDFSITSQTGVRESMDETLTVIACITVGIAAISLLVGGIGIMNIMFVTVVERTREIGTRRALGATRTDIVRQFLVEAVIISLFGGMAGLAAGSMLILAARAATPVPASLTGFTALAAVGFSTAVGVVSGLVPALRAARIDPVEALRHE
ncbi:MAG: ABC transporter permease [Candidatus Fermentibacter sp.]|nr:ABC transporter permease [Candidatus Fermentibacter sp.]